MGAVLVMGTDRDEAYGWRAQSHAGALPGALLYTAGRGFGVPQGLPPAAMGAEEIYRPTTPEEARRDVRELAPHHPDVVKMWVTIFLTYFHRCFHTKVWRPSSPGAVVPLAAFNAFEISRSVIGSHGISFLCCGNVSSLGSAILGKKDSMKILALS